MKMQPIKKGRVELLTSIEEKMCMVLKKVAQESTIAPYRVIRKQESCFQSSTLSDLVGFLESRLKSSSRRGNPAQVMAMKTQGLGRSTKSPTMGRKVRMQQGSEVLRRLSLPKMSSFCRGSHFYNPVINCVIAAWILQDKSRTGYNISLQKKIELPYLQTFCKLIYSHRYCNDIPSFTSPVL